MSYRVSTQLFEGPFDLLLQLVSRQKVDIGALSLSEVADQYLAEIEALGDIDLSVASDFLVVASTLLEMKAASLIPDEKDKVADLDDDMDLAELSPSELRDVLVARLIVYKQFRNVAATLNARMQQESCMYPRTVGPDPEFLHVMPDYLENVTLRGLAVICADLNARKERVLLEAEHIAPKRIPLSEHVSVVRHLIGQRLQTTFSELIAHDRSPEQIVVTFLALLELFKQQEITFSQEELFGDISIQKLTKEEELGDQQP